MLNIDAHFIFHNFTRQGTQSDRLFKQYNNKNLIRMICDDRNKDNFPMTRFVPSRFINKLNQLLNLWSGHTIINCITDDLFSIVIIVLLCLSYFVILPVACVHFYNLCFDVIEVRSQVCRGNFSSIYILSYFYFDMFPSQFLDSGRVSSFSW